MPPWGGRNAAGCVEAAAAISRRTVPPMESTWNSPGRQGRAGKCSVSMRHRRDEAGLRLPLPGRGRGDQSGLAVTVLGTDCPGEDVRLGPGPAARPDRGGR